jgi:hypothetical protein
MAGAEHTGPGDDSGAGGAARSRSNSETVTRRGVKQKREAESSSMVVESNHLLSETREPATGSPNLYVLKALTSSSPWDYRKLPTGETIASERVDRSVEGGVPPWWNDSRPRLATNTEG